MTSPSSALSRKSPDLVERIGEVASSPAANTMMARLKNIEGYTDGIEAPLAAIQTAVESTNPVPVYNSHSFVNITTKTTTVVKASAGTLVSVIINKSGSTDTLTIYDNTAASGTLVGIITSPTVGMEFRYLAAMGTGITVVSGGGTAGDYTVTYR